MSTELFGPVNDSSNDSLESQNPGEGLLTPQDWIALSEQLGLTSRELSVAVLIFEGKSRFQISRQLRCAPGTVRVYIDRMFAKLNVTDRLGMVLRIVRVHLGRAV